MFKKLIVENLKLEFKDLIYKYSNGYISKTKESEKEEVNNIINKEIYTLDDVIRLCKKYKGFSNEELMLLIANNKEKSKFLANIIKYYLICNKDYEDEIINQEKIGITSKEINVLDKYLNNEGNIDNKIVYEIIIKIKNNDNLNKNENIRRLVEELLNIFTIFNNNLLNLDLINLFLEDKVESCNNYYFLYKNVMKKLKTTNKNLILTSLIFMDNDSSIKLNKEDLISYIKYIEENGFVLNKNSANNLVSNFKRKYYKGNNLESVVNDLINKVILEYDEYCSNNFAFRKEEFILHYNSKYNDDFSPFYLDNNYRRLNSKILDSIFYNSHVNNDFITLDDDLSWFKSFREISVDYKISSIEDEKYYLERCKFYLKYIDKIIEFYQYYTEFNIYYYMIKNIDESDRTLFLELFKSYYKDKYRKLMNNSSTSKKSVDKLKIDFITELNNSDYNTRYEIFEKYKSYSKYFNDAIYKEEDLIKIFNQYEENGFIEVPKMKKSKQKKEKRK